MVFGVLELATWLTDIQMLACMPDRNVLSQLQPTRKSKRIKNSQQKQCDYCNTTNTTLWRHGPESHSNLCNACGVKFRRGKILSTAESQEDIVGTEKDAKETINQIQSTPNIPIPNTELCKSHFDQNFDENIIRSNIIYDQQDCIKDIFESIVQTQQLQNSGDENNISKLPQQHETEDHQSKKRKLESKSLSSPIKKHKFYPCARMIPYKEFKRTKPNPRLDLTQTLANQFYDDDVDSCDTHINDSKSLRQSELVNDFDYPQIVESPFTLSAPYERKEYLMSKLESIESEKLAQLLCILDPLKEGCEVAVKRRRDFVFDLEGIDHQTWTSVVALFEN